MTSHVMGLRPTPATVPGMDGFGGLLRRLRTTRRLSQEQLAFDAEISTRHLSYLETGKSKPSREMVLVLANALELELRDRNTMLSSAGFSAVYASSGLESLEMTPVRRAIELILAKQEPYGAIVLDRVWNVLRLNDGALRLLSRFLPEAAEQPELAANIVKSSMHPKGLRPWIVNWVEVATFALERLERDCVMCPTDEARRALRDEVRSYPGVEALRPFETASPGAPVSLVHLKRGEDEARLFVMITSIGTPLDVTAQELSIETYFPADDATERWTQSLVTARP